VAPNGSKSIRTFPYGNRCLALWGFFDVGVAPPTENLTVSSSLCPASGPSPAQASDGLHDRAAAVSCSTMNLLCLRMPAQMSPMIACGPRARVSLP
jgi:hypothetical protein